MSDIATRENFARAKRTWKRPKTPHDIQYQYPTYACPALQSEYTAPKRGPYRGIREQNEGLQINNKTLSSVLSILQPICPGVESNSAQTTTVLLRSNWSERRTTELGFRFQRIKATVRIEAIHKLQQQIVSRT
jgi:hypothetical protein